MTRPRQPTAWVGRRGDESPGSCPSRFLSPSGSDTRLFGYVLHVWKEAEAVGLQDPVQVLAERVGSSGRGSTGRTLSEQAAQEEATESSCARRWDSHEGVDDPGCPVE